MNAITRRAFLRSVSVGGAASAVGLSRVPTLLAAANPAGRAGGSMPSFIAEGNPLRTLAEAVPRGLELLAKPGTADVGDGVIADAWMLNDSLPSPLLRVRTGERFQLALQNELREDLILHWHGLTPPQESDGHPRFAVGSGGRYEYDFTVGDRAGTYWYHSHAHLSVGAHTYRGIGGMIIVEDDEEEALGLPSGDREIPIILQDRTLGPDGVLEAGFPGHDHPAAALP